MNWIQEKVQQFIVDPAKEQIQESVTDPIVEHFTQGWQGFVAQLNRDIFDILIVLCIMGIFMNMAGNRSLGRKLTGGSIVVGLMWRVVFFRG